MAKRKAHVEGEFRTHQALWNHAQLFDKLIHENRAGHGYQDVEEALACSMLLTVAFAVEAFANSLLELRCPNEYANERQFFSTGQYQGPLGKVHYLADNLGVAINRGKRPFQTIKRLFLWRDSVVHGRVERILREVSFTEPAQLKPPNSELMTSFRETWASHVFDDAKALCTELQRPAYNQRTTGVHVPEAFSGLLGIRGISILPGKRSNNRLESDLGDAAHPRRLKRNVRCLGESLLHRI